MTTNIIPFGYRELTLAIIVITVSFFALREKMSLKSLGIRKDNIKSAFLPYFLFTMAGGVTLYLLAIFLQKESFPRWWEFYHLQFAFLPISIVQEFIYRSFFQTKLEKIISPFWTISTIAVLYAGMHILWRDPLILFLTFFAGIAWGYLWYKFPNLLLISLSHAILNFIAVYYQFFTSHLGY